MILVSNEMVYIHSIYMYKSSTPLNMLKPVWLKVTIFLEFDIPSMYVVYYILYVPDCFILSFLKSIKLNWTDLVVLNT